MERKVIFREGMDNDPSDYTNLQDFAQESLDHIVGDGITSDRRFAGLGTAASSVTEITVQPGRLFSGGKVYRRADVFTKDFTNALPVVGRKIISLVVFGQDVDTDTRPREFLINEETGESEPQQVAMERARVASVDTVAGEEAADPVPPIIGAGYLEVARIELTPAGISSVTMMISNQLVSTQNLDNRMAVMEAFKARTGPQVQSLAADLAALTKGQAGIVSLDMYGRTLGRVAVLEAKAGVPESAVDSAADFFLDGTSSDLVFAGSNVKVEEGMRFADEAADAVALQIFDALNPKAKIVGGVMFPAYVEAERLRVGPVSGEVAVSTYSYAVHDMVQKTMSRMRVRYGRRRLVSSSIAWLKNGRYDATTLNFRRDDEAWDIPADKWGRALQNHLFKRNAGFWIDTYEEPYWEEVTTTASVNGTQVAETFLNANDMWLSSIGLTFTALAADGAVTVALCETDRGLPLLDKVIAKTTVDFGDLEVGEVKVPMGPVFLTGGNRYAIVIMTAADHRLGTVQGSVFPEGTFFYVLDGAYQQGDATRDLAFTLYACQFTAARTVVELNPLSLAGGIADIDILAPAIVPGATQLSYEIQIGGTWHPLAAVADLPLGSGGALSPLLAFRAVFTGTPDVMPAVSLTGSRVMLSRGDTALTHVSDIRTLPGVGSDTIRLTMRLEDFVEANHDCTCVLLTGAGYATVEAADAVSDVTMEDGTVERTFVFDLAANVTSYRIKTTGALVSALAPFHIAMRKDWTL